MSPKIIIVEDEPIIIQDISDYLSSLGYDILGKAYTAHKALQLLGKHSADLVLLDINLNDTMDGVDIANVINEKYNIPFVYLTSYADQSTLARVKKTNPAGYVVKPFEVKDLFVAIELGLDQKSQSQKSILSYESIVAQYEHQLTQKECHILWDIYQAKSNKQMADEHFISTNTIKSHVKKIYEKLDVHSRAEVMVKLRRV